MTEPLFRADAYAREVEGTVTSLTPDGGIVLDRTIFYATGGGQPGDSGRLEWEGGSCGITTCLKGAGDDLVLIPEGAGPPMGAEVRQILDWESRHARMRVHTALHLLSVVLPHPVTGGAIGEGRGRLDFDMEEAPEARDALAARLADLVARDLPVSEEWITEAELDANPGLVKTLSVSPPRGAGRIRLVRIGAGAGTVDLQPCGGTHVARTAEIGQVDIGKIEKKGRRNRRVAIVLSDRAAAG